MRKQKLLFSERSAFTLAEVLITLAVIGIVAAMTIPTLIQKYQEKATVTKLKKVYSVLSQAFTMAVTDNGETRNWNVEADDTSQQKEKSDLLANIFIPYLKTAKVCHTEPGCWYDSNWYSLNGNIYNSYVGGKNTSQLMLNDGTMLAFGAQLKKNPDYYNLGWITADINGAKKPNKYGVDVFAFYIYNDKLIPFGLKDGIYPFEDECKKTSSGLGCTAWVIYNENLDYLHCDDLSWDGKHKCD